MATLVPSWNVIDSVTSGGCGGFEFRLTRPLRVLALRGGSISGSSPFDIYLASLPDGEVLAHAVLSGSSGWNEAPLTEPITLLPGDYAIWHDSRIVRARGRDHPNKEMIDGAQYLRGVGGAYGQRPTSDTNYTNLVDAVVEYAAEPARVRSSVSEDAGSLFQATQAVAVELGLSEAFPYGEDAPAGQLRLFREALTPDEVAVRYYPLPTRNQEMLTTVEGETNLGRLAHTIAPRIFTRGTSIPGNVGGIVTAQQAIQHVVNRWASEHPWLVFEPIPDLRVLIPEAVSAPRQYYVDNPDAGVLTTSNVVIEQEGNERRTMREVLDEWLQVFPGTIVRQTSRGTIELVPRVGPDAPEGPELELTWRDFARFSDGEDDPRGVYNRARTTSQGWEWEEEHPLLPPLVTVGARGDSAPASAVDDLLPLDAEPLPNNQEREFSTLVDPSVPVQVDVVFRAVTFGNKAGSGAPTVEATIPASFTLSPFAVNQHTFTWTIFDVDHVRTTVNFKRSANGFTVEVPAANRYVFGPNPFVGMRYGVYIVEVTSVTGTAWTRSNTTVEAEWGTEEHHVPAEGGGDALAQSRAQYGVRSATIQSNIFQLTPEQAMAVARGYVLHNINPRTVRDVQQSEWDRYPVKFDHIGRYVELPNGEVAVVENRSYSDSFAPRASAMMSSFTATVSHSVIDTTTEYLFNSDGSYWENDDGTISEVL